MQVVFHHAVQTIKTAAMSLAFDYFVRQVLCAWLWSWCRTFAVSNAVQVCSQYLKRTNTMSSTPTGPCLFVKNTRSAPGMVQFQSNTNLKQVYHDSCANPCCGLAFQVHLVCNVGLLEALSCVEGFVISSILCCTLEAAKRSLRHGWRTSSAGNRSTCVCASPYSNASLHMQLPGKKFSKQSNDRCM